MSGTLRDRTGDNINGLLVLERAGTIPSGHAGWKVRCPACGNVKVMSGQVLQRGRVRSCGCLNATLIGDALRAQSPDYYTWHRHMRKIRGSARGYDCVDCGFGATEWSLQGAGEQRSAEGYPFTRDVDAYVPRCKTCHNDHDRGKNA